MESLASNPATQSVVLRSEDDFEGWRDAARSLAAAGVRPEQVVWRVDGGPPDLFAETKAMPRSAQFAVPAKFIELAKSAACHSDPQRFALLYAMLCRIRSNHHALEDEADLLLRRLEKLAKDVRRDAHKMHAFVRFREVDEADGSSRYVAYFEPDHHIVRREAGFFVRRFANMRWSILTPRLSIHWDGDRLSEGPGGARPQGACADSDEEAWKTYFAAAFNPARLKVGAMLREMPKKYWRNMPETSLVGPLIATARAREIEMIQRSADRNDVSIAVSGSDNIEAGGNLRGAWDALRGEARACTRCHLHRCATQTVFGEGPLDAPILFVGEQPGDREDLAGRPFVGPAGQLFDAALEQAGIDRRQTYVTNAVKHFKFVQRGKKRIHSKPDTGEISACRWWLERELDLVRPPVTVALGATAARSLLGKAVTIGRMRGRPQPLAEGGECWVTVHPSYLLRIPEETRRAEERARFIADLRQIGARAKDLVGAA